MRYHIYHSQSHNNNRYDWDVTEDFVELAVHAYLRGKDEVTLDGEKVSIGSDAFLIYENPSKQGVSGILENSLVMLNGAQAQFNKEFFNKNFKNVTQQFLFGRKWGDLKEDYYNVFVDDVQSKSVILVINEQELLDFLNKWSHGERPIWVSGARIDLNDPKSIKIYDISYKWLSKDRGDIKYNIKKYTNLVHKGTHKIDTLEHFGKDITDKWNIEPFGKSKNNSSSFDWAIIHPEIYRVANSRFNTGHYADAVEAAFKEINDTIKKEYKTQEGKEEDGTSLMRKAFAHQNPIFKLTDLSTDSLRNIQQGYMDIFVGTMLGIRNPKAHANLEIDQLDSWEKIVLASHLMKMWDKRSK